MTLTRNSARQCSMSCVAKTTTSEASPKDLATAATFSGSATSTIGHSIGSLRPSSFRSSLTTAGDVGAGLARGSGAGSGRSSTSGAGAGGLGFAIRAGIATRPTGDEVVDATLSEGRYMFPTPLTYARYTNVTIARAIKAATPPRRFMTFPPPRCNPRCRHCRRIPNEGSGKSKSTPSDRGRDDTDGPLSPWTPWAFPPAQTSWSCTRSR